MRRTLAAARRIATRIATSCLAPLLFAAGGSSAAERAPAFAAVVGRWTRSDAVLLDRAGRPLQIRRVDPAGRRLDWTPLGRVSPAFLEALVRAEDRRFFEHRGVDWLAAASAGLTALRGGRPRGASTITMQVAAMVEPGLKAVGSRRSAAQKLRQALAARGLERAWTKGQVLEAYVNLAGFRGELQGIAAASRGIFDKEPHGLAREESLLLAVLPRGPEASPRQAAARASALARSLGWPADGPALEGLAAKALAGPYRVRPEATLAPHAAERILRDGGGAGAQSRRATLDARLQRVAREALAAQLSGLRGRNVSDAALLAVDNRTGEALAYVGHPADGAALRHVDGVRARRQAGSTLKPFLYAHAFDARLITPESLLDDSPLDLPQPLGLFCPGNYDHRFRGLVPARVALASSLNVPAVRLALLTGVGPFLETLGSFGIGGLGDADFHGPALALGAADVTLWDLVGAYRALANGGVWTPLTLAPGGAGGARRRVVSPEAAYRVARILSDRADREETFGLESVLATPFWTAVKTGTSKDMRDNWCVGFSERYTVGVWVGNFGGEPMWSVSGVSGAAPAWLDVMSFLHRGAPSRAPTPPAGLAALRPARPRENTPGPPAAIEYPPSGAILAIDPDIPAGRQVVFLRARGGAAGARWLVDGADAGRAEGDATWLPAPGRHSIALAGPDGKRLDAVEVEVRGSAVDNDEPPE